MFSLASRSSSMAAPPQSAAAPSSHACRRPNSPPLVGRIEPAPASWSRAARRLCKAPPKGPGRHALLGAELAVEVGEAAVTGLLGDVGDRPAGVDQQRAGLADAELGDVIGER